MEQLLDLDEALGRYWGYRWLRHKKLKTREKNKQVDINEQSKFLKLLELI